MDELYRKLWILLREQLTKIENDADAYSSTKTELHNVLTRMAEMEAMEFLKE